MCEFLYPYIRQGGPHNINSSESQFLRGQGSIPREEGTKAGIP